MKNVNVIVALASFVFVACEGESLQAEYDDPIVSVDAGPTGNDANTGVDVDGDTDSKTDAEPKAPVYVCVDDDKDGFCAVDSKGKVVDCNDSGVDADGDGIVDGIKFAPGLTDVCDALDNDCDGQTDEDAAIVQLYVDKDGDGYGAGDLKQVCSTAGFAKVAGDCDDTNANIHPGAEDKAGDGIDADCDDEIDELAKTSVPATLTIYADGQQTKLALSHQVFTKYEDLGDWWDSKVSIESGDRVQSKFDVPDNACGVRFNVTFGSGATETWACIGSGDKAAVGALVRAVELDVGPVFYDMADVKAWPAPDGGCSLLIVWNDKGECAPK